MKDCKVENKLNIRLKYYCEFIFFNLLILLYFIFILLLFTTVFLGVVKIEAPWTWAIF